jgi:2-polyprenyl-6-methoxyphenol hydroxylase-like FAD-dependent oxidoreductase
MADYDIITVGGGLAGSSLAMAMAPLGHRVLVIERETAFKDRVRGEQMAAWGVADAQSLGVFDVLRKSCAHQINLWDTYIGSMMVVHRELAESTPQGLPNLTFYHPAMQEALVGATEAAGATVIRGARVTGIEPGAMPSVTYERNGSTERASARLVAATDGRNSPARKWCGFVEVQDSPRLQLGGVLLEGVDLPDNTLRLHFQPNEGRSAILFPQGGDKLRAYFACRTDRPRLSGAEGYKEMINQFAAIGVDRGIFERAKMVGPLATFAGADCYVPGPYRAGVALVGDAAATSDPAWGQGLSLTMRDVRTLRDKLVESDDWDAAGKSYATAHDEYYGRLHEFEDWFTTFWYDVGPAADAMRARAFPLRAAEGFPDPFQSGPESTEATPEARRHFFAEDAA